MTRRKAKSPVPTFGETGRITLALPAEKVRGLKSNEVIFCAAGVLSLTDSEARCSRRTQGAKRQLMSEARDQSTATMQRPIAAIL
jgi:hypothetical protein